MGFVVVAFQQGSEGISQGYFLFGLQESAAVTKAMLQTQSTDTCVCAVTGDRVKGEWPRTSRQGVWTDSPTASVLLEKGPKFPKKDSFSAAIEFLQKQMENNSCFSQNPSLLLNE